MHFTVHLRDDKNDENDFSYGLAFIPCPVWIKGTNQILNLNRERPDYRMGSIKKLISQEKLKKKLSGQRFAHVIIHPVGHGSIADLVTLQRDLLAEGFSVTLSGEIDNTGPFAARES